METFQVNLKTLLGLVLLNQHCHVIVRKNRGRFLGYIYHGLPPHLQCPYYTVLSYCMIQAYFQTMDMKIE